MRMSEVLEHDCSEALENDCSEALEQDASEEVEFDSAVPIIPREFEAHSGLLASCKSDSGTPVFPGAIISLSAFKPLVLEFLPTLGCLYGSA
jgi:hypothetical protein